MVYLFIYLVIFHISRFFSAQERCLFELGKIGKKTDKTTLGGHRKPTVLLSSWIFSLDFFFRKKGAYCKLFLFTFSLKKNLIFRERVIVPHILEISASLEDGIIPETKISKPGQPDPVPRKKKFNRLSLSKRKKEARKYSIYTLTSGSST